MSKGMIIFLVIVGVLVLIAAGMTMSIIGRYNSMQQLRIETQSTWAEIQNQLMRRYDLIPNLVETVKGYAAHEQETFQAVTEARARVGGMINIDENLLNNAQAFERFQQAQNSLGGALQRLMMVTENYPELKANQNFIRLQDELAGTENRIAVSRKRFNDSVAVYNKTIIIFPNNMLSGMFGFTPINFFEAPVESQQAPQVRFGS